MITIPFFKMSGSGNDFIIIDNREAVVPENQLTQLVTGACRRKMSVGADGMILIESSASLDFKWRFFNADGSLPDMCGNGARCAARFAFLHGIADRQMAFETLAGTIEATVGDDTVKIRMTAPRDLKTGTQLDVEGTPTAVASVNTGVPHVVMVVDDIEAVAVTKTGRLIRYHPDYAPDGTNVNFVTVNENGRIFIRTYERGVEDETLACGTGNVAAALILAHERGLTSPVTLTTRGGGSLTVHFSTHGGRYRDVFLEGDARVIYRGDLWEEAWRP
ncbi:diaminopimelate epimerase [Desulfosarcina sp.]|uniref:diaminopimelate epimerase n=1 Tax=Desulfosarcina sp. TaxID=2027861 RepID=UPI0035617813